MVEPEPDPNKKRDRSVSPIHGGGGAQADKKPKVASPPSSSSGSKPKRSIEVSNSNQANDQSSSLSDSLEEANAALNAAKDKNADLTEELRIANSALDKSKNALAAASEELADTNAGWSETKDDLANIKGQLADANDGWNKTKGELADREDELAEANKRNRSSDKTIGLLSDKLEQARNELKEIKAAAESGKSNSQDAAEMAEQLRSSHKTVSLLSDSLEEAQAQLAALKQSYATKDKAQNLKDRAQALRDKEQVLKDERQAEKDRAQALRDEEQVLKDQRQAEKDREQSRKDDERAVADLARDARDAARDDELKSMHEELAAMKEERRTRETAQAEELASIRASNEAEMALMRASNEAEVADLQAQLKEAKADAADRAESAKSKSDDDLASARARIQSVHQAATELSGSLDSSATMLAEIKSAELSETMQSTYQNLRDNLAGARAEIGMLKVKTAGTEKLELEDISKLNDHFLLNAVAQVENCLKSSWTGLQSFMRHAEDANQSNLLSTASSLRESLQKAGSDLTALSDVLTKISQATRDRVELQQSRADLAAANARAVAANAQVGFLTGRLEIANSRFDALEASAEAQLQSSNKTVSRLSDSLDEARAELSILKGSEKSDPNEHVVEKALLSLEVAGRVIGKGGETIRDLHARSGAHLDVDQSALPGKPRTITYQGPRAKVELAKELVRLIASGASEANLPLGEAKREAISIPATAVGRVIGRGGEIVRELQNRSRAKVDFDHDGSRSSGPGEKVVLVTGTPDAVVKAKEMVLFIAANPDLDAVQALNVLVDDKLRAGGQWGSGVYPNLPNRGVAMTKEMFDPANAQVRVSQETHRQAAHPVPPVHQFQTPGVRTELVYCKKQMVGRLIGSKGTTIRALQQRSATTIQIKQDVPFGADCEIKISGSADGVSMAKQMINQIIMGGADHLFGLGKGPAARTPHAGGHTIYQTNTPGLYPKAPPHGQYQSQHHAQGAAEAQLPPAQQGGAYQQMHSRVEEAPARQTSPRLQPMAHDSGWRKMTQPDGRVYYWNEKTQKAQWEKPPGMP